MLTLPTLTGHNLMGRQYTLPLHLEGNHSLLLLSSPQTPPDTLASWQPALQHLGHRHANLHYHELPIDLDHDALQEWALQGAQRAGVFNDRATHTTITIALHNPSLPAAINPAQNRGLVALLVDKNGRLLWQGCGKLNDHQRQSLTQTLTSQETPI